MSRERAIGGDVVVEEVLTAVLWGMTRSAPTPIMAAPYWMSR